MVSYKDTQYSINKDHLPEEAMAVVEVMVEGVTAGEVEVDMEAEEAIEDRQEEDLLHLGDTTDPHLVPTLSACAHKS